MPFSLPLRARQRVIDEFVDRRDTSWENVLSWFLSRLLFVAATCAQFAFADRSERLLHHARVNFDDDDGSDWNRRVNKMGFLHKYDDDCLICEQSYSASKRTTEISLPSKLLK